MAVNLKKSPDIKEKIRSFLRLSRKAFVIFLPVKYMLIVASLVFIKTLRLQSIPLALLEIVPTMMRLLDALADDTANTDLKKVSKIHPAFVEALMIICMIIFVPICSVEQNQEGFLREGWRIALLLLVDVVMVCLPGAKREK